jgi:hypothetical protein
MNHAIWDLLKWQLCQIEGIAKTGQQFDMAAENERLMKAWDEIETARQLKKYGVE